MPEPLPPSSSSPIPLTSTTITMPPSAEINEDAATEATKPGSVTPTHPPLPLDIFDPFTLPRWRKWTMTLTLASMTLTSTFASSVFSSTQNVLAHFFGVSPTVLILGVSLYVLGFALGPIVWGPLSEFKGRRMPLFGAFVVFTLMQIPLALAESLPAILVCRLIAGCFGAAPVTLVSAMYSDYWEPADRGIATAVYSAAVYVGPTLGPIFGALLTEDSPGWRWTAWLTLIMAVVSGLLAFVTVPETYAPILRERALKKQNAGVSSRVVEGEKAQRGVLSKQGFVRTFLIKPFVMMVCEPMLIIMTLYISIVYGILYLSFYAFPYSFAIGRQWDSRVAALPFLSILIGVLVSSLALAIYTRKYYQPRLVARGTILPEDRLPPMIVGSFILPVGLFWFGWTSGISSWVPQVIAGFFIGSGIMLIFTNGVVFLVDVYLKSAASAIAANTCVRSLVAAGFPLAAPRMYESLGIPWATSVLGFLCVLVIPAPLLFYRYGHRVRQMSRFAATPA